MLQSSDASWRSVFTGISRLNKLIVTVIAMLHLFYLLLGDKLLDYIAIVPGEVFLSPVFFVSIPIAGFVEVSTYSVVVNCFAIIVFGKLLEPIWGTAEYFRTIIIVNFCSSIATLMYSWFVYIFTMNEEYLFQTYYCGATGITAVLLVGMKQHLFADREHSLFGFLSLRMEYLPILWLTTSVLLLLFGIGQPSSLPFTVFGFYISWLYIRFFQRKSVGAADNIIIGDLSDTFAFVTFFPEVFRGPIAIVSDLSFSLFARVDPFALCGVSTALSNRPIEGTGYGFSIASSNATINDSLEAEQRRARAAKALEQRLAQMSTPSMAAASAPALIAPDSSTSGELNV